MRTLLLASLLLSVLLVLALTFSPLPALAEHQPFKPCCASGASPWASESPDTAKANPNAGFIGSELPPSSGYNPDHLDKYTNPALNNLYQQQRPENPPVSSESYQQRYGGDRGESMSDAGGR